MAGLLDILEGIAKSPEGEQKLKDTKSPDDVVSLVKDHGMDIVVEEVHKVLATKGGTGGLIDHLIEGIGGSGGQGGGEGIIGELLEGVVGKGDTSKADSGNADSGKAGGGGIVEELIEGVVGKGSGGKAGGEGIIEELLEGEGGAGGILGKLLK